MPTARDNSAARRSQSEWLLLGLALLVLAAFVGYTYLSTNERAVAIESERLRVQAEVIADDMERSLTSTNVVIERVIRDFLTGNAAEADGTRTPQILSRRLRALVEAVAGVRGISVFDRNGVVVASSRADLVGQDFSHREYFTLARDQPDPASLYLSAPFKSIDNELLSTVARMVPGPDGSFAGVILATLDPGYFARIVRPIVYAPDVWALVVHGDGLQLTNYPTVKGLDGTDQDRAGTFFRRHLDSGRKASVLTGVAYGTGQERMMALRTVQPVRLHMDKPLVLGVSRELDAITLPLQRQGLVYGLLYGVLAMLCCAGLYWSQSRRAHIDAITGERDQMLLDAAERVQLALRGANLGLWEIHVPTGGWTCDENTCAMVGYTMQEMAGTPVLWRERMHPQDRQPSAQAFEACVNGSTSFHDFNYRIQHHDGHWIWIMARGQAIERDVRGRAVRVMGTVMDISVLKQAETDVLQARNELQAIFDNMTEALLVYDSQRKLLRANRAGRSMHGLFDVSVPVEEMVSLTDLGIR